MKLFIVDNSNIYVSLKQQYTDVSVRFDYEKLVKKFADNNKTLEKILVGSTPPKSDSFWGFMERKGWTVYTYERGRRGEKGVDAKIVTCGMNFIHQCNNRGVRGHLYIVSGDLDMLPLVEEAINRNIEVTIISWFNSFSQEYLKYPVEIEHLDEMSEELVFFERAGYRETLGEFIERVGEDEEIKKSAEKLKSGEKPSEDELDKIIKFFLGLPIHKKILAGALVSAVGLGAAFLYAMVYWG